MQDEGVRGGEREERPPDPRARQEEQPLGGEGQMRHHVELPPAAPHPPRNYLPTTGPRLPSVQRFVVRQSGGARHPRTVRGRPPEAHRRNCYRQTLLCSLISPLSCMPLDVDFLFPRGNNQNNFRCWYGGFSYVSVLKLDS